MQQFLKRAEAKKPGSYILLGNNLEHTTEITAYIGEGEPVESRLKAHAAGKHQKDFWDKAIVFTSKDDYITKTQIQYLESEIYRLALEAGKVKLDNAQMPTKPNLSEVDNSEMKQFLDGAKLILSSVGIDILESQKIVQNEIRKSKERIFHFKIKNAIAKMKIRDEKFIVLKGSAAVIENRNSASESIIKMRQRLENDGVMKKDQSEMFFVFEKDYIFNSPSYAGAVIAGGEENGRIGWKYNGKSLSQIEETEIVAVKE